MKKIILSITITVLCFLASAQTTDGIQTKLDEITSLDIYPNPFTHDLNATFELTVATHVTYILTDELGKIIFTENAEMSSGKHEISPLGKIVLRKISAGKYFFTVFTDKGSKITKPLIKN
jgi:hypothetical protein